MARVALVTGGTRGIGKAIVERLKADGMEVAAGYSGNVEAAEATARELGVMVVKGNVGSFEDCERAVTEVEDRLGPIDVLVNNAGITRDGFFHKMTHDQWSDVIRVNMDSVFNMTRQVIGGMRDRGFGRIVNISSIWPFWPLIEEMLTMRPKPRSRMPPMTWRVMLKTESKIGRAHV